MNSVIQEEVHSLGDCLLVRVSHDSIGVCMREIYCILYTNGAICRKTSRGNMFQILRKINGITLN